MTVANEVERIAPKRPSGAGQRNGDPSHSGQVERGRLRVMILIRRFEERVHQEYQSPRMLPDGSREMKIGGFCHLYSGQEAIAIGTAAHFDTSRDYLITGYRCHGASLALGMTPHSAMAELYGKATGCSKGKGGSMHFFQAEVGNLGGHGIVGGQMPLGLGTAFAQKYKGTGGVTFCFMGDGAINQGTFNEALNMASLLKAPAIFVVENNGVAMGTQVARSSAEKDLAKRGCGFNMPHRNVDGNDVDTVIAEFGEAVARARAGEGPSYLVANTYRFRGHSMSDPMMYRKMADGKWRPEVEEAKKRDPIAIYSDRLIKKGLATAEQIEAIEEEVSKEVEDAIAKAEADPNPPLEDRFNDILAEKYPYEG